MLPPKMPNAVMVGLRRQQLAAASPYGSIAQREDPTNYGSIARRTYPGIFGSQMPTRDQQDDAQIQNNQRILTLRNQRTELAMDPTQLEQLRQQKLAYGLRRVNGQLNPLSSPSISGLDPYGDEQDDQ